MNDSRVETVIDNGFKLTVGFMLCYLAVGMIWVAYLLSLLLSEFLTSIGLKSPAVQIAAGLVLFVVFWAVGHLFKTKVIQE